MITLGLLIFVLGMMAGTLVGVLVMSLLALAGRGPK
jgi:hypothetical protein